MLCRETEIEYLFAYILAHGTWLPLIKVNKIIVQKINR